MTRPEPSTEPPRRKKHFTIRAILVLMLMVAVAAAGFGGLLRSDQSGTPTMAVLFVIAAPVALLLAVSLFRSIDRILALRKRQRPKDSDP